MSNVAAAATSWNCVNYTGELYLIGANQTPFLAMAGGLQGDNVRIVKDQQFPMAQPWSLEAASQPAITETASLTAPTPTTYTRGQDVNTVQIYQEQVSVSYTKQAVTGQVTADATTGLVDITDSQPIQNERDFQIMANLRQISIDVEYTFLNGVYQQATSAAVAAKTRGIITGCTTNAVAAAGAALSKDLINELLRDMADNGAQWSNPVIFCNSFQKQAISELYGYAPESRNVGGVNILQIETDFAPLGIVWDPQVPTDTLLVADMSYVVPTYMLVPEKGVLFYEELSKTGASEKGQIYGHIGLDYGPEEYHGKLTGLSTS
jgi:hypothetical protein